MKRRILLMILSLAMMTAGSLLPASANGANGFHTSQLVFRTQNNSNYRIPTIINTASGAVFAFCNDRQQSVSDYAEIQWLSYSVARDGVHFSDSEYLLKKDGWSYIIGSAVYDAEENNIILIYYANMVTDAAKSEYNAMSAAEREQHPLGSAIIESRDDGKTWTRRTVKMPQSYTVIGSTASVHGAGAGIQLKNGEHAGRLVFAAKAGNSSLASVKLMQERMTGLLIYSDDHGKTWQASLNSMPEGTDETAICELSDGTILISSRMISNTNARAIAYSYDGGRKISDKRIDTSLEVQCEYGIKGSVISIPDYDGKGNELTMFSSLNSPGPNRRNLCVWISYDGGKSWPEMATIDAGLCSYSEMTYNETTGLVSIVYERGDVTCYSSGIEVATFDTDWLLENKRPNRILRGDTELSEKIVSEVVRDDSLIVELSRDFNQYAHYVKANALAGYSSLKLNSEGSIVKNDLTALTGNMTYFIVFKSDEATADDDAMLLQSSHAQGIRTHLSETTESVTTYVGGSKYNCAQAREYLDTDWHILAVTWNGDSQESALLTQFQDGMTTLKYELGKQVTRSYESKGTLTIGKGFCGEIAEVLVWNRALTDTEVAQTGLALAEKYGLNWTLKEETPPVIPPDNKDTQDEETTATPADDTAASEPAGTTPNESGCRSVIGKGGLLLPLTVFVGMIMHLFVKKRKQKGAF